MCHHSTIHNHIFVDYVGIFPLACSAPLGVETSSHTLVASASLSGNGADSGRLRGSSSWCADKTRPAEYLQVHLLDYYFVTAVATQGGAPCFARTYSIMYRDANEKWVTYGRNGETVCKTRCSGEAPGGWGGPHTFF